MVKQMGVRFSSESFNGRDFTIYIYIYIYNICKTLHKFMGPIYDMRVIQQLILMR